MAGKNTDPWLSRWLPLVSNRSAGLKVLELGCGWGWDSATLCSAGLGVIGVDISQDNIAMAKLEAPQASFHCQDIRTWFPSFYGPHGAIVASLSLHYFSWSETRALIAGMHEALTIHGVCLVRLNSVSDVHHGAAGHPEISRHYYSVNGKPKRFFDRDDIEALFDTGWKQLALAEMEISRFKRPKVVWEMILEKDQ